VFQMVSCILLIDESNQITNLTNLSSKYEIINENGDKEVITVDGPRLIHVVSFVEGTEMNMKVYIL